MAAKTLSCPSCGASVTGEETSCRYCSSRLARAACPACFGMMFVASRFCPHCGAEGAQAKEAEVPALSCPDCKAVMTQSRVGETVLHECVKCHGLWVDSDAFRRICADREGQSDVLGSPALAPRLDKPGKAFRYRACPCCKRLMNRYNFANASGVVIDTCKGHGVWFDRDELRQIIEFIRAGGLELTLQRELDHLSHKQRWTQSQRRPDPTDDVTRATISAAGGLIGFL